MVELIDTNIILRYLVGDDALLYKKAERIFKEARNGKRRIGVKVLVVAESCYVLESFYKKTKEEISKAMEVLLSQKWLVVEDRSSLLAMWSWYRENLHFVDSFLLAYSYVNKSKLLTFDATLAKRLIS